MKHTFLTCALSIGIGLFAKAQTIQEGIAALESDKLNKATQIFNNLIRTNPNNAEAYFYLGNVYIETEKADSAKWCFNKALTVNPQSPYGFIGMGIINLNADKAADAKTNFDKALLITKEKDIKTLQLVADAYATTASKSKDTKKAIELATKAVALDKKNAESYIVLGDAYLEENNGGQAMNNYENATSFDPANAKAYLKIGQLFSRSRNFNASLEGFNKAIEKDPNYAPAYRDLGELYFRVKKYDKAKESYKKYLELAESNTATLTRYAYMLFMAKDYAEATSVINQISAIDSTNIILKRLLGYSYYEQNKHKDGLANMTYFFKKVEPSRIIPSDYEYLGKLYYKNGKDSLAAQNLMMAIELDSTKSDLYYDLGDVYLHWKKFGLAQNAFNTKISKTKSSSAIDYFGLGKAYYYNKQYVEADSAFSKIVQLKPNASAGYLWRARANNVVPEKDYERARPFYEKYLEIAVPDPKAVKKELSEAYMFMGYYSIQKDDKAKAKEFYNKVLEIDPENKQAKELIKQL